MKTPPATPPSSAAPNAEPSSTAVSSSGRPSTEATIRSQSALRAPPPETRPVEGSTPSRRSSSSDVAQPEGDALEHRPDERATVVPELEADERAAGVGVGMRRPLAGEVRREEQAVRTGRPPLGLREQLAERGIGREPRRETTAASRRRRASRPSRASVPGTA